MALNYNNWSCRLILSGSVGSVALEAAIALPSLMLVIFSFVSFAQLISIRSLVYDEVAIESRNLSVTDMNCGTPVVSAAVASKNRIIGALQARGIVLPPADIQVTADQSSPQDVQSWTISAQFTSQCTVCQTVRGLIPFDGFFSVNMTSYRDALGCY